MTNAASAKSDGLASTNPYASRGLVTGRDVLLRANPGIPEEGLATVVELVRDDRVEVCVPIPLFRPLRAGSTVEGQFHDRQQLRRFLAEVVGHGPGGSREILGPPQFIDDNERRGSYRLAAAMIPTSLVRLPAPGPIGLRAGPEPIAGVVIDLSDGGIGLWSAATLQPGDRCGITLDLGESGDLDAIAEVVAVEDAADGRRNRRIHCRFVNLPRPDRDRVARFLTRKRLDLRATKGA